MPPGPARRSKARPARSRFLPRVPCGGPVRSLLARAASLLPCDPEFSLFLKGYYYKDSNKARSKTRSARAPPGARRVSSGWDRSQWRRKFVSECERRLKDGAIFDTARGTPESSHFNGSSFGGAGQRPNRHSRGSGNPLRTERHRSPLVWKGLAQNRDSRFRGNDGAQIVP